jgi:hypothetical protein
MITAGFENLGHPAHITWAGIAGDQRLNEPLAKERRHIRVVVDPVQNGIQLPLRLVIPGSTVRAELVERHRSGHAAGEAATVGRVFQTFSSALEQKGKFLRSRVVPGIVGYLREYRNGPALHRSHGVAVVESP